MTPFFRSLILALAAWLILPAPRGLSAFGPQGIMVNTEADVQVIRSGIFHLEDPVESLSIGEAFARLRNGQWRELPAGTNNLGITHPAHWFSMRIENGGGRELDLIVELN